jgi:hypothetical protein
MNNNVRSGSRVVTPESIHALSVPREAADYETSSGIGAIFGVRYCFNFAIPEIR